MGRFTAIDPRFDISGHDYKWAVKQLKLGKRVRRKCWPLSFVYRGSRFKYSDGDYIVPQTYMKIWHVFPKYPADGSGFIGWGGQVGADDAEVVMGHRDGTGFSPSGEEALAEDWELAFCE